MTWAGPFRLATSNAPRLADDRCEAGYVGDRPPGREAGQEQHLGLVEVADAGQVALVEQGLADRATGVGEQPAHGFVGVPVRVEQVRAEVPDDARLVAGG